MAVGRWPLLARPRRVIGFAAAASVSCVALSAAAYGVSQARPQDGGAVAETFAARNPPSSFTQGIPSNMRPALDAAADDVGLINKNGCNRIENQDELADCVVGDPDAIGRMGGADVCRSLGI